MKNHLVLLLTFLLFGSLGAQGLILPLDNPSYQLLERLSLKYGFDEVARPAFNPGMGPIDRSSLIRTLQSFDAQYGEQLSKTDRFWLQYTYDDNNEWLALPPTKPSNKDRGPKWLTDSLATKSMETATYRRNKKNIFNYFYRTPANLLEINRPDFFLRLNPILDLRYGPMQDDAEDYIYNRRGLELRSGFDERLFLYFQIVETQNSLPNYLRAFRSRFDAVPGAGFVKEFSGQGINAGIDFLNSQGILSFDISPHVGLRTGYGNHKIGMGERSLLLSDFSNNYPFLQLNWKIWKFHYQNLFAELTASPFQTTTPGQPLPKKYMVNHHLSINLGKRLNVGVFETVILNRENGFELAYLNPVIFYRTIEGSLGSPDNVLIGVDANYQFPSLRLYTQFILDEFKFDELFQLNRGWWGNKWAWQIGAYYVDALGLDQLNLRVEYNRARPYTYTHTDGSNSYTHFGMPLAHPLGANFSELILQASYRPLPRLQLDARLYLIEQGEDDLVNEVVFGEDINTGNRQRSMDLGNEIGQGIDYSTNLLALEASYMLSHNLFLEAVLLQRAKDSRDNARDQETTYVQLGFRLNVARRKDYF